MPTPNAPEASPLSGAATGYKGSNDDTDKSVCGHPWPDRAHPAILDAIRGLVTLIVAAADERDRLLACREALRQIVYGGLDPMGRGIVAERALAAADAATSSGA